MSFFRSILGRDWRAELERAESLLAAGDPVQALEIASRARRKAGSDLAPRAAELVGRARSGVRDKALSHAAEAEAAGDLEDSIDWLQSAIEHEANDDARAKFELRVRQLEARLDRLVDAPGDSSDGAEFDPASEGASGDEFALDLDSHYETIADRVAPELRARYDSRPEAFRRAVVDLNEGRGNEALAALAPMAGSDPGDAILRLELGRARRFLSDPEGALVDFDAAWRALEIDGLASTALDAGDTESIDELWAESAIEAGRLAEVTERLGPLADLDLDPGPRLATCAIYAWVLQETERAVEAESYLRRLVERAPNAQHLRQLHAMVLLDLDRDDEGLALLESIVESGCRTGCSADQAHLPAFWALGQEYSDAGRNLDRARELFVMATQMQNGALAADHYRALESYFRATDDRDSADRCRAEAERLAAIGEGAASNAGPLFG